MTIKYTVNVEVNIQLLRVNYDYRIVLIRNYCCLLDRDEIN